MIVVKNCLIICGVLGYFMIIFSLSNRMRCLFPLTIALLMALTITVEAVKKGLQLHLIWYSNKQLYVNLISIVLPLAERGKEGKSDGECPEWVFGRCVPNSGDCGAGVREGTCNDQTKKTKCKIPCNWKKDFGGTSVLNNICWSIKISIYDVIKTCTYFALADCKYKFGRWSECEMSTGTRSRSGTLKKAMFNADCQSNIKVSKPCSPKTPKPKGAEKKGKKAKEN